MRSFPSKADDRRKNYLNVVGQVESQLREAYAERSAAGQATQSSLAAKLGVGRSVVNRRLTGRVNMTIETLADMAWALGKAVTFKLVDPAESGNAKPYVTPCVLEPIRYVPSSSDAVFLVGEMIDADEDIRTFVMTEDSVSHPDQVSV